MPCDSVITTVLNLDKANLDAVERALQEMGFSTEREGEGVRFSSNSINGRFEKGRLVANSAAYSGASFDKEAFGVSYSSAVVTLNAESFGWAVTEEGKEEVALW